MTTSFVLEYLLGGSMSELWLFVNQLQIIVLIPLCKLPMPANAKKFFSLLMEAAAFDYYDTDDMYMDMFQLEETQARSTNFSVSGYQSMWFIVNLGTLAIVIVLFPLLFLLRKFMKLVSCGTCCKRANHFLKQDLYWRGPLMLIIESYVSVALSCFLNTLYLHYNGYGEKLNTILSLVFFIVLILVPVLIYNFLDKNWHLMNTRSMTNKYGILYNGIRSTGSKQGILVFLTFFYIRRLILTATVVYIQDQLFLQFCIFVATNIAKLALLFSLKPYTLRKTMRIEVTNEVFSLIIVYHMICFTDWIPSISVR